ncbi:MAG TPA: glycosyltransferase family 9 protein [Candidatus Acidoferrales bacterium]|nr:glycosyltransferase family 9 protein [Candidatus Acidoferrales bacterium]
MFANAKNKNRLIGLLSRHLMALGYALKVILPMFLRTGRRPVIFTREGGMGDIICTIPAVRELKKRHSGAGCIYNCHQDSEAIPRLYGIVDQVTSFPAIGLIGHWYRFLTGGFYQFIHGNPYVVRTTMKDFCDQFNVVAADDHPHLDVAEALRERARKILEENNLDPRSFITIHAGPTVPVREWPREHWVKLVALLRERGFTQIAQLGVGHYSVLGQVAVEPLPGAVSLIDRLSLEESLALISLAKLHIGVDSGLLHVAAAVGTPGVGLFGSSLPEYRFTEDYRRPFVVSRVECRGCGHWLPSTPFTTSCPNHIRCMREITPEEVLRACLSILRPSPSPAT